MSRLLFSKSIKTLKFAYNKFNCHKFLNLQTTRYLHDQIIWGAINLVDINFSDEENIKIQPQSTIDMRANEKPATIVLNDFKTVLSGMNNYFDEQYFTNCDCSDGSNICSYQSYSYPGMNTMNISLSTSNTIDENAEDANEKKLITFPEKDLMQVNAALPTETINYNDVIDAKDFYPIYKPKDMTRNLDEEALIVASSFQWDGSSYNKKWVYDFDRPNYEEQLLQLSNAETEKHDEEEEENYDEADEYDEEDLVLDESHLDEKELKNVIYSNLAAEIERQF